MATLYRVRAKDKNGARVQEELEIVVHDGEALTDKARLRWPTADHFEILSERKATELDKVYAREADQLFLERSKESPLLNTVADAIAAGLVVVLRIGVPLVLLIAALWLLKHLWAAL
jgi:hypothetical protein